jgi:hypothetical protein
MSCACWYRSSGFFSRTRLTMWFSSGDAFGRKRSIGSGSSFMIEYIIAASCSPRNGVRPVSISYSTTPNEKMSERASLPLPCSCSGAM